MTIVGATAPADERRDQSSRVEQSRHRQQPKDAQPGDVEEEHEVGSDRCDTRMRRPQLLRRNRTRGEAQVARETERHPGSREGGSHVTFPEPRGHRHAQDERHERAQGEHVLTLAKNGSGERHGREWLDRFHSLHKRRRRKLVGRIRKDEAGAV